MSQVPYRLRYAARQKIGYSIGVLRQTACLVVNPIKVNSFAYLLNCTTVGRATLTGGFLLLRNFSVTISVSPHVCFILVLILISMFLR